MTEDRPAWQRVLAHDDEPEAPEPVGPVYETPLDRAEDPREQQEWFARLPDDAKDEMRERWRAQEGEGRKQRARRKQTTHIYIYEAAVVLLFMELLVMRTTLLGVVLAVGLGAAAGGVARLLRAGPALYGGLLLAAFVFQAVLAGFVTIFTVFGGIIVFCLGIVLGKMHYLQKFDGSEL